MDNGKKRIPIEEGLFHIPSSPEEKPYLIGSKCDVCNIVTFPKIKVCPRCVTPGTMKETRLSGRGTLDTFTIVNAALPGFKAPSIQAYVNLEEGPTIWSLITGVELNPKALKIGMDLELAIEKVKEDGQGNEVVSYQFRPTKEQLGGRAI